MSEYVISVRNVVDGAFGDEPSKEATLFLRVPDNAKEFNPSHSIAFQEFRDEVAGIATRQKDLAVGSEGDVLIFVHGYNNSIADVLQRTRLLRAELARQAWQGTVIAFDWPSENSALNYLEDRRDAANTAIKLVTDCVLKLAAIQDPSDENLWKVAGFAESSRGHSAPCRLNLHLLGHSTGAYVIMEAFAQAEKIGPLFQSSWRIAQVAFIGADVACDSLALDDSYNKPMLKRTMRLTNYQNGYDDVLAVSNAKRLGTKPRAGRVGLPHTTDRKIVNVDCSAFFHDLAPDSYTHVGWFTHSWHVAQPTFCLDLAMTLEGRIDRDYLPTRRRSDHGLVLQAGSRPPFETMWSRDAPSSR